MKNITGAILIIAFLTAPAFAGAASQEQIVANLQQQIAVILQKILEIQAKLLALIAQQTQEQIEGMEEAEPGILEDLEEQEEVEPSLLQLEEEEVVEETIKETIKTKPEENFKCEGRAGRSSSGMIVIPVCP